MNIIEKLFGKPVPPPQVIEPQIEVVYLDKEKNPVTIHLQVPNGIFIYNRTGNSLLIDRVIDIIKKNEDMKYVVLKSIKIL